MIKRAVYTPIALVILGLALIYFGYLLADGQMRIMPLYGFPEPAYGCNFDDIGKISFTQPPELSRGYRESELLWCYPPKYYPFYALALIGTIICGAALFIGGKTIFRHQLSGKEYIIDGIGAIIVSLVMAITGGKILKLELNYFGGGGSPPDIFNILTIVLVIAGLSVGIAGIVICIMGTIKILRNN